MLNKPMPAPIVVNNGITLNFLPVPDTSMMKRSPNALYNVRYSLPFILYLFANLREMIMKMKHV
jgi:hypothetical protein